MLKNKFFIFNLLLTMWTFVENRKCVNSHSDEVEERQQHQSWLQGFLFLQDEEVYKEKGQSADKAR